MHPILYSKIFLYIKLFTTIILSWNSLKCIRWSLLVLSDPFIKNENSILSMLIEKNFEQKIYFCLLKMRSIFLKEGKSNFFDQIGTEITDIIFSISCKTFKIFPFILFENRRLAQGIRRPKATDSPLIVLIRWKVWKNIDKRFTNNNISSTLTANKIPKYIWLPDSKPLNYLTILRTSFSINPISSNNSKLFDKVHVYPCQSISLYVH